MPIAPDSLRPGGEASLQFFDPVLHYGEVAGRDLSARPPAQRSHRWIMTALVVVTLTLSALGWSRHLALSVVAAAIASFGVASSLGLASIMVQESVPDALRGRVMSLYSLAFTGVMPFAALGVARLADVIGMRRELLFAAVADAICGVLLMPMLRKTNRETHPEAAQGLAQRDSR